MVDFETFSTAIDCISFCPMPDRACPVNLQWPGNKIIIVFHKRNQRFFKLSDLSA